MTSCVHLFSVTDTGHQLRLRTDLPNHGLSLAVLTYNLKAGRVRWFDDAPCVVDYMSYLSPQECADDMIQSL